MATLARGGALNLIGAAAHGVLGFAFVLVVTRSLGLGRAGALLEAVALFTIVAKTAQLGTDVGLVRFVARSLALRRVGDLRTHLAVALAPVAALGVFLAVGLWAGAAPLSRLLASPEHAGELATLIRFMSPLVPLLAANLALEGAVRGFGTMVPSVVVDKIARPLLQPALVLAVAAAHLGVAPLALAWAGPLAASAIFLGLWVAILLRRAERAVSTTGAASARPAESFWAFTAPRALAGVFAVVILWLDTLLVGALESAEAAAIYAACTRFAVLGSLVALALTHAIEPQLTALLAGGHDRRVGQLYQSATGLVMAVAWPLYLILALAAPVLVGVFGPGYASGSSALTVLALAGLAATASGPVDVMLLMAGRSRLTLLTTGAALVVNVVLNLVLIPRLGITGAGAAWAASIVVKNGVALLAAWRTLRVHPFGPAARRVGPLALAYVGTPLLAARTVLGPTLGVMAAAVVVGVVLYSAALWRSRTHLALA